MVIKYKDLCSTDFVLSDVVAYRSLYDQKEVYDYETTPRTKNLIFYQLKNQRHYCRDGKRIATLSCNDMIFAPHGVRYKSFNENPELISDGIGISFDLQTPDGEAIYLDEDICSFSCEENTQNLSLIKKIHYYTMNPGENILRLKSQLYTLLDNLFSDETRREKYDEYFRDISPAIEEIEKFPERNRTLKELADMCHMSESSFLRKFKEYSGGTAPHKYRNNIRLMIARELSSTQLTVNEIAEKLGFYDGAHLAKAYKKFKGTNLKYTQKDGK